jgi:hypothetical protein
MSSLDSAYAHLRKPSPVFPKMFPGMVTTLYSLSSLSANSSDKIPVLLIDGNA